MRVALDTNVLAYAEGVNGEARRDETLAVLERLPAAETLIPVQVLGELFHVLVRRAGRSREEARRALLEWTDVYPLIETAPATIISASDLASDHKLGIWDAVIMAAASTAGCRLLMSEDLQGGFTWGGVTVANPYADARHPLLEAALD